MFDTSSENLELKRRKSSLVESLKVLETLVRASNKEILDNHGKKIEDLLEAFKKEIGAS